MSDNQGKKKRYYHKTTKSPAAHKFALEYAKNPNGAAAVAAAYPNLRDSRVDTRSNKANRLLKNTQVIKTIEQQRKEMERIASNAVAKVDQLIQEGTQEVAGTNARWAYEQVHGKATQRIEQRTQTVTLTLDLTGGKYGSPPDKADNQGKK